MRCNRARRMLAQKASQDISIHDEHLLADHLSACAECARLEEELERTWSALGCHPTVEPSADFLFRIKARLQAGEVAPGGLWNRLPALRWQWVALAGCALLAAVLLTKGGQLRQPPQSPEPGKNITANHDRWDEQFLDDLEQTLQYSAADALSAYDSWPVTALDTPGPEASRSRPAVKLKKKEPLL
ncbi:MAG: hypothetical protein LAP85_23050 [Acidobacteriia bacterium]|nr:hypothetical protein [Terriglobia bacterium]